METQQEESAIKRAIRIIGSAERMGKLLTSSKPEGVSRMGVHRWVLGRGKVPAEYCPDIERMTGVKCEELRPDVNWAYIRGTRKSKS